MDNTNEKPFITTTKTVVITESKYNPNYGDDRECKCGHPYYRHFDTYEDMANVGCKYSYDCGCIGFEEETNDLFILLKTLSLRSGKWTRRGTAKTEREWMEYFPKLEMGDCEKNSDWFLRS